MQQLVEPAVFAQDERVVEAGDQQDVVHAERHQVLEALEEALGGKGGIGSGASAWSCATAFPPLTNKPRIRCHPIPGRNASAVGAEELSPALQRWVRRYKNPSPFRDGTRFLPEKPTAR